MKEKEEHSVVKFFKGINSLWRKIIITAILAIIIIVGISMATSKDGKVTIVAESELVSVIKKNSLNTAEYIYNGIASIKDKKGNDAYYISYEGTVVAGINFDNIKVRQDDKNKKVIVTLPKIEITENKVDNSTIDIIFVNNNYNTETIHATAYNLAKEDLEKKASANESFLQKAEEKSNSVIKALVQPLINANDSSYELVIEREK